jgi:hypothetical protein
LVSKKVVPNKLAKEAGTMQNIYEVKVKECSYHVKEGKKISEVPVVPEAGSIILVGGRSTIDGHMTHVKRGQVFGLKFTEEVPSKTKGYNDTKVIKVYTPKDDAGEYEMDAEFLAQDSDSAFNALDSGKKSTDM